MEGEDVYSDWFMRRIRNVHQLISISLWVELSLVKTFQLKTPETSEIHAGGRRLVGGSFCLQLNASDEDPAGREPAGREPPTEPETWKFVHPSHAGETRRMQRAQKILQICSSKANIFMQSVEFSVLTQEKLSDKNLG